MNLIIDVGNTRAKLCVFCGERIVELLFSGCREEALLDAIGAIAGKYSIDACIACSVGRDYPSLGGLMRRRGISFVSLGPDTPAPVRVAYGTPGTLGMDRLAAAAGAGALFPGRDALVVDAGTAITFDYLSSGGVFEGGNISPGLRMRLRALHDYTSRLPLAEPCAPEREFAVSTLEALSNGAVLGVLAEIEAYWGRFKQKNVKPVIILTGGDSIFLSEKLKITIFAEPNLVLIGLNRILNYNVLKTV